MWLTVGGEPFLCGEGRSVVETDEIVSLRTLHPIEEGEGYSPLCGLRKAIKVLALILGLDDRAIVDQLGQHSRHTLGADASGDHTRHTLDDVSGGVERIRLHPRKDISLEASVLDLLRGRLALGRSTLDVLVTESRQLLNSLGVVQIVRASM